MNEDENGITPRDVTAITVELIRDSPARFKRLWSVTIEQGNGDVLKMFELTEMECVQLGAILAGLPFPSQHVEFTDPPARHVEFVEFGRRNDVEALAAQRTQKAAS